MVENHGVEKFVCLENLAAATVQTSLESAQADFAIIVAQLQEKEVTLAELQKTYDKVIAQQQMYKQIAEGAQKKLHSAQVLVDALSGEKGRWENDAETLNDSIFKTVGNATIGAAFNSYCGMFNHTLYIFLYDKWPVIIGSSSISSHVEIDIISLFVNEATLYQW